MANKPLKIAALLVASAMTLAGCAGRYGPYGTPGGVTTTAGIVYVQTAPPPQKYVIIPRRPAPTAVWIEGYWDWTGVRFVWVDGLWNINPPRAGVVWVPHRWVKTNRGWYRKPGEWRQGR